MSKKLKNFGYLKNRRNDTNREEDIRGILVKIEPNENTRYLYEIWFPYTLDYINRIKEGRFLIVQNFTNPKEGYHYSILEITYIEPIHYAVHNISKSDYPEFVEEAMHHASIDLESQVYTPEYPTTKIIVKAIPTNLEIFRKRDGENILQEEENIPMLGKEVYILDNKTTEEIINKGMEKGSIEAGYWIIDPEVKIKINVEELLRKHFGIFGFTGAGKSNLLSTLIRKIVEYSENNESEDGKIKLVIWDLMSEYYSILIDVLYKNEDSYLIAIGKKTFTDNVIKYLNGEEDKLNAAAEDLIKIVVSPKEIKNDVNYPEIKEITEELLKSGKIKVLTEEYSIRTLLNKYDPLKGRKNGSKPYNTIKDIIDRVFGEDRSKIITSDFASELLNKLKNELNLSKVNDDIKNSFNGIINALEKIKNRKEPKFGIKLSDIISKLNNKSRTSLFIFISHDPNEIRNYAHELGMELYENRRKNGIISPIVSFIFDEADEIIPQDSKNKDDSYKKSSDIAMTIARRGRKFGIGLGIATQRIRYLNTSIMAQPHTYFVSKLPRKSDREAVAEAFGLGLDMFNQTFKFRKGDWLVISHDALGMEAVPIMVHFENANEKVLEFLKQYRNSG